MFVGPILVGDDNEQVNGDEQNEQVEEEWDDDKEVVAVI